MNGSNVINDLHVAFATLRNATFLDCPNGVDIVLTGNGMNRLTLTIVSKLSLYDPIDLAIYNIFVNKDDEIVITMILTGIRDLDYIRPLIYATSMVEKAHNIIVSSNYEWRYPE